MATNCGNRANEASDGALGPESAEEMVARVRRLAEQRAEETGEPFEQALRSIAPEVESEERFHAAMAYRAQLLNIAARRRLKTAIAKFPTLGQGLVAVLEGTADRVEGARLSVDAQARATHGQYLGQFVARLEEAGVFRDFRLGGDELMHDVYVEMGEIRDGGQPGRSGNPVAQKIATALESVTGEMVARQNLAGANIVRAPGYIVRQTHDMDLIRRAGGEGLAEDQKLRSYLEWKRVVLPLLDHQRTFNGFDADRFLRNVHEALYTGIHGPETAETESFFFGVGQNIARKASSQRVLWFRSAEAAYTYNQRFGMRNLRDQVFSDIFYRARSIALMETFGPNAGQNFQRLRRELAEIARARPDADVQADSLNDHRIEQAWNMATGLADVPKNFTLARRMSTLRAVVTMAKMGGTVISSFADKMFLGSEMAFQGFSALERFAALFRSFMPRSDEDWRMVRLMGVALDGIIGSTITRYTSHASVAGTLHRAQQRFFDWNFMNWWTDTNKAAAAEVMSAHLAEHADLEYSALPEELRNVLSLYGITPLRWEAIRRSAWTRGGQVHITPDQLQRIPMEHIDNIIMERGNDVTSGNRARERFFLETQLRAYFHDRVDYAIPTPGAKERRITTFGGLQPGTPFGEFARLLMMFKSFPLTVMTKVLARDVYGGGQRTLGGWIMNDHAGKFRVAQLIAMTTIAGYLSGVVRDMLRGRTPKRIVEDDKVNWDVVQEAMMRGGGAGILGDFLFAEYDKQYRTATAAAAGPVLGQVDNLAEIFSLTKSGEFEKALGRTGKFVRGNVPYINLFYIKPVMDYLFLWNLQEMLEPGSLARMEREVRTKSHQDFWLAPTD